MTATIEAALDQRWCRHCQREASFSPGNPTRCRECAVKKVQDWRRRRPETYREGYRKSNQGDRRRGALLVARYGITLEEYEAMYAAQDGRCAVCLEHQDVLDVDHDHESGRVRGLLCRKCNLAVGLLNDNPERAVGLALYLMEDK